MKKLNIADPGQLDSLEEELKFMEKTSQRGAPRIKIEKNHQWLCRFLPVALGPRSTWYARIAFYWMGGRPYLCRKDTAPDFGGTGEPDELYNLIEKLLKHRSEKVQKIAQRARPTPQWLTYCLVFERDDGRKSTLSKGDDMLIPHECWHYKNNFSELYNLFRKGQRRAELSILDLEKGSDIWLMRTNRGMRFEREDPSPIFDVKSDEEFNSMLEKVFDQIDFKAPEPPSDEKIEELCAKLEDEASVGTSRGRSSRRSDEDEDRGSRSSRRSRQDEDDEDDEEDDVQDRRSSRSSRSSRDEDDEDEDKPRSSRRSRQDEDEAPRRSRKSRDEDDEDDEDEDNYETPRARSGRSRREDDDDGDEGHDDDDTDYEPDRKDPPSRSKRESEEDTKGRLGGRRIDPPPAARRSSSSSSVDDEEDNVTDESKDPAPPSKSNDDMEEPPPVSKSESGAGVTRLSDSLKGKLANFKGR